MRHAAALLAVILLVSLCPACGESTDPAYVAEVDAWHKDRVARLKAPTGWLTLIGLHEIPEGAHGLGAGEGNDITLAAGPERLGEIGLAGEKVVFMPAADVDVWRFVDGAEGARFDGGPLATDADGEPDQLACGSLVFYPIQRGEQVYLRVKDRDAALRRDFAGIERYMVDAHWRVEARLVGEPGLIEVTNVLGQTSTETVAGELVGKVAGYEFRMLPLQLDDGRLFLVLGDETNGHETYPGGRFVAIDAPREDGTVIVDFNKAYNPPCAFTEYSTCELPVPENTLPVAIRAGEKKWGAAH